MDYIKFNSTLKASGSEYKRIVYWNRFFRNKTELILSFIPAAASIALIAYGFVSSYLLILYAVFWFYPIFIISQFKSNVSYHLKHRDPAESAPCRFTLMKTGILAEIDEYETKFNYNWEDFTTIYSKFGYYMMFKKGDMIVMIRQDDIPEDLREAVNQYMKEYVNQNECKLLF